MSVLNTAEKAMLEFLRDPAQRVFVLKGPWGVGKSYFGFIREDGVWGI